MPDFLTNSLRKVAQTFAMTSFLSWLPSRVGTTASPFGTLFYLIGPTSLASYPVIRLATARGSGERAGECWAGIHTISAGASSSQELYTK